MKEVSKVKHRRARPPPPPPRWKRFGSWGFIFLLDSFYLFLTKLIAVAVLDTGIDSKLDTRFRFLCFFGSYLCIFF